MVSKGLTSAVIPGRRSAANPESRDCGARSPLGGSRTPAPHTQFDIPAHAGIQYAAASRLHRWRLWNTGSPAGACHRAAIRPTRWRAMTTESATLALIEHDGKTHLRDPAAQLPGFCLFLSPRHRGSRECRVRAAPAVSCAKLCKETHTSIQVQRKHSGIPRAEVLRLMPRSPRRRIRRVTVIDES